MRPIDADKFKSRLEKAMEKMHLTNGIKGVDVGAVIKALEMQPTLDVVPRAEVARLQGVLLQFTDIAHKWGAKNNIDTSEISLVPILQEEADSIIKNANQEYAREIFEEIESIISPMLGLEDDKEYVAILTTAFAELKKKYTEDKE